ncbi:NRDE protein-domain-containing protein [Amanita rubescens]|nr:NRDE protein-domain-containing protein [Amanita rubescens]
MCIGTWTLEHPEYALILCSNRDESLDRPTQSAHFHSFAKESSDSPGLVLSGLDERAGGTWVGINRAGRVALLTNITEAASNFGTSRGVLVSSFLLSDGSLPLEQEAGRIATRDTKFSGFNLMLFAPLMKSDGTISYESLLATNHGAGGVLTSRPLSEDERCCGGVSNGIDEAGGSDWPKVKRATNDFDAVFQSLSPDHAETELVDRLMDIFAWVSSL